MIIGGINLVLEKLKEKMLATKRDYEVFEKLVENLEKIETETCKVGYDYERNKVTLDCVSLKDFELWEINRVSKGFETRVYCYDGEVHFEFW